jgi:hypothetical protein
MALRDGEPHLCWGSPGGDQQDQWSCQFLMRTIHAGHNLQQAIDAPAWHSEHFPISFWPRTSRPGVLVVESRVGDATVAELRRRGHIVEVGPIVGGRSPPSRDGVRRSAPPPARHAGLPRDAECEKTQPERAGRYRWFRIAISRADAIISSLGKRSARSGAFVYLKKDDNP